jgi:toxin ParE1/3/4
MVIWSLPAKDDLKRIYDYISEDSKFYAREVIENIVAKADSLLDFPKMGREVPEIGDPEIREYPIYSYRIIYKCRDKDIEILTIVHSRQIYSP